MTAFRGWSGAVREEWIDYNGHLNDGAYAVVLSEANEVLLESLGLSASYRETRGAALYTVEGHLRYLAEASLADVLVAESVLVAADAKRLRVHTVLKHADGRPVATGEHLYLHVDVVGGGVVPLPADRQEVVQAMLADHADLERPAHLGLGVGARSAPR